MGFFSSIGDTFKSIGQKISSGVRYIGKKSLQGLDYGIQGLKIASDFADKYTLGLDHFIPYYSALKAGIDISDHIRKMAKGEEKLNWTNALSMGLDVGSGLMSAYGGKAELEGIKGGMKMFKTARATGSGLKEAVKIGGGRVLRGYGLHKEQIKQMGQEGLRGVVNISKGVRKGNPKSIAKLGLATGVLAGSITAKVKADDESNDDMRRSNITQSKPQPRILQKPQPVNINTVPIGPPKPLVFRGNAIYQNGRLVG